jgi:hypothetical protein
MSSSEGKEITPWREVGLEFEPSPLLVDVIKNQAQEYLQNNHIPLYQSDNQTAALKVVVDAYQRGMRQNTSEPKTKSDIKNIIQTGLQIRTNVINQGRDFIKFIGNGLKYTEAYAYGIDSGLIWKAQGELNKSKLIAQFSNTEELYSIYETRKELLEKSALGLAGQFAGPDPENQAFVRIITSKPTSRAIFMRGVVASALLDPLGDFGASPMFLPDTAIDALSKISNTQKIEVANKVLSREEYIGLVIDNLVSETTVSLGIEDSAEWRRMLLDYTKQIFHEIDIWTKSGSSKLIETKSNIYWRDKYRILSGLPIRPFIQGEQYIFIPEDYQNTGSESVPSLWQNAERFGNYLIAAPKDLRIGIALLSASHQPRTTFVEKLKDGLRHWEAYDQVFSPGRNERVKYLSAKAESLLAEAGNIKDLALSGDIHSLNIKIRGTETTIRRRNKLLASPLTSVKVEKSWGKFNQKTAGEIKAILTVGRALELQVIKHELERGITELSLIDFSHFFLDPQTGRKLEDYKDKAIIESEMTVLNRVLQELNKKDSKILENVILKDKKRYVMFFTSLINHVKTRYPPYAKDQMLSRIRLALGVSNKYDLGVSSLKIYFNYDIKNRLGLLQTRSNLFKRQKELENYDSFIKSRHNDQEFLRKLVGPEADFFQENNIFIGQPAREVTIRDYYLMNQLLKSYLHRGSFSFYLNKLNDVAKEVATAQAGSTAKESESLRTFLDLMVMNLNNPILLDIREFKGNLSSLINRLEVRMEYLKAVILGPPVAELAVYQQEIAGLRAKYRAAQKANELASVEKELAYKIQERQKTKDEFIISMNELGLVVEEEEKN